MTWADDRDATEAAIMAPMNLDAVAAGLRNLYRLYRLAEPEGDTRTFITWIVDELRVDPAAEGMWPR